MKYASINWQRGKQSLGQTTVGLANSFCLRLRGLLARAPLKVDTGLLIKPCNAIHTVFMGYPIDVVFIGERDRIVHISAAVKPWRARLCFKARYVIELPAHDAQRLQLRQGDQCLWAE